MFKKIIIALLIGLILVPSVSAAYKGEVYDYQGYHRREKVNYSLLDADTVTGGNGTFTENVTASWFGGLFNWTLASDITDRLFDWSGSTLTLSSSELNDTVTEILTTNRSENVEFGGEITADAFIGRDFLVGYWPLNENADDISGNGNDGTINGDVTNTSGKVGKAYYFDGKEDYINISNAENFNSSDEFTISAWFRADSNDTWRAVVWKGVAFVDGFILEILTTAFTAGNMTFSTHSGNIEYATISTIAIEPDKWYHVVGVYKNPGSELYINGKLDNTHATSQYTAGNKSLLIGRSLLAGVSNFNGTIDEVVFWNRTLSANEVKQLYLDGESQYDNENTIYGDLDVTENISATCYQVGSPTEYVCQDNVGEISLHTLGGSTTGISFYSGIYNLLNISALGSAGAQPTKLLLTFPNADSFIDHYGTRIIDFQNGIITYPNSLIRITGNRHQVLMDADFTARTGMYEVGAGGDSQWGFNGTDSIHRAGRIVGVGNHWFGLIGEDDIYFNNSRAFGNSIVDGNITANYFVGDGSELTDIDIGSSHNTSRLTDYAVGNWWFEKDSIDSSGNDNGGTVNGNPVNTTGIVGNAYEFDGDGDYISFGDPSWTNSEGTISAWIKPISTGAGQIVTITKGSDATNGIQFYTGSNNLYFYLKTSSALINFNNPLTMDSAWHHVAVTQDGTTSKMYIDGAVQSNTDSGEWLDDLAGLAYYRIGNVQWSGSDTNHFNGTIDEVLIFNRSLGANEIKAIYDSQKRGTPHQTIATENIIPLKNNTYSLGSSALRWLNGWFSGDLEVGGNITSENVFIPQYIFSHTNKTQVLAGANIWTNVTFDQEVAEIMQGISHTATDDTNTTFTIMEDGVYSGDYDFDLEDTSISASDIDIAGRLIFVNGTEVVGSDFESGIEKNGVEKELSHDFLFIARAGDSFKFQFVADDADVVISTHGTFGDHPESASIIIKKEANL